MYFYEMFYSYETEDIGHNIGLTKELYLTPIIHFIKPLCLKYSNSLP